MLAIPPARIGEKDKSSKKRRYKLHPKDKSHENVLAKVREMLTSGHEAWKDLLGAGETHCGTLCMNAEPYL